MLSRTPQSDPKSDLDARAAYQFYLQINSILALSDKVFKKPIFMFHDNHAEERKKLAGLKQLLSEYKKLILQEEQARAQYAIPAEIYKKHAVVEKKLERVKNKLKKVKMDAEVEKNKLSTEESFTSKDLQIEEGRLVLKHSEAMVENNKKYDELDNERDKLLRDETRLDKAISNKCCGCFPWRVANERNELLEVQAKLRNVDGQISALGDKRDEFKTQQERIGFLTQKLAVVRQNLIAHINEYPQRILNTENELLEAEIEYGKSKFDIEKDEKAYYATVSENVMQKIIALYDALLDLKENIDTLYAGQDPTKQNSVTSLAGKASFAKDRLDELADQISCPANENKNAETLYQEKLLDQVSNIRLAVS